jgi:hypothetical protein
MGTSLFDSTPSINQMMGLLSSPQQPMQPITAQQMPQTQPNLPQAQQPKLVDRLQDRLSGLLQSVRPKAARGYEGLLSSEEVESARPGIFRTLFHQPGETAEKIYRERLDNMVKMKEYAQGVAQQKGLAATREKLAALFPAQPNESEVQRNQRLEAMGAFALQHGDEGTAKSIAEFLKVSGGQRFQVAGGSLIDLQNPDAPKIINGGQEQRNPIMGSPEWIAAQEALAGIRARHRVPSSGGLTPVQEYDAEGNPITVLRPKVAGLEIPGPNTRTPAAIQKAIAENTTQMSVIDEAMKALDAHPDAVGLKRGMADLPLIGGAGDAVNQRRDPGGVEARALISNISSLVIKDRSGAAVSVSESGRLRPFIPSVGDTPATIRIKLAKLRQAIEVETRLYQQGGASASTPKGTGRESGQTGKKLDAYRHLLK